MKENFSQKNFNYIFILLFCFYICLPPILFSFRYLVLFDNNFYLSIKNILHSWHPLNNEVEFVGFSSGTNAIESNHFSFYFHFFSISSIILFFFGIKKYFITQKINVDHSTILAIKFLTVFSGIFFLGDISKLILNYFSEDPITNRKALYDAFLNKRLSHVNVFLINVICLYFLDRKWFYIGAILIFIFDVLSLSRIELFYFALIFFILTIKFDFKNFKYIFPFIIFLFFIIFYRSIIHDQKVVHALLWEPYSIYIGTLNFWENFFYYNSSLNYNFFNNDNNINQNYIIENWNYLLKNFFYINNEIINYHASSLIPKVSARGINFLIPYLLFFVLLTIILFVLKKIYKLIDGNYFNIVLLYAFFSIFRGNTVHTLAFCVKLLILTLIFVWIIKIIKLLLLKVG